MMDIKVIIADDHAIIREGLKSLLENKNIDVVGIAQNGRDAINQALELKPDIVMMDISMPDMNGVEATLNIKKNIPETKVIALSIHSGKNFIDKMFSSGASGYVLKECAFDEIYDAICEVSKGNFYLSPSIARTYVKHSSTEADNKQKILFNEMTNKEREVLQLIAEGQKTRDIAEMLNVSIKTIEAHRRNIMKKLNIFNIAGLTKYAIKEGIISLE